MNGERSNSHGLKEQVARLEASHPTSISRVSCLVLSTSKSQTESQVSFTIPSSSKTPGGEDFRIRIVLAESSSPEGERHLPPSEQQASSASLLSIFSAEEKDPHQEALNELCERFPGSCISLAKVVEQVGEGDPFP